MKGSGVCDTKSTIASSNVDPYIYNYIYNLGIYLAKIRPNSSLCFDAIYVFLDSSAIFIRV